MPEDYAAKQTDKELAKLERKLSLLYAESKADLDDAVDRYYNGWDEIVFDKKTGKNKTVHHKGMKERYQEEYQAYLDGKYHDPSGKYTDEEMFNRYVWSQEGRGKHIEAMRDDMAKNMTHTNQRAAAMINDKTPGIYSLNANWEAYKIESVRRSVSGIEMEVAFNIVREQTVKELVTGNNHVEFRVNSVNPKRDYAWNKDQITKALASGILQGESPYQVADRYMVVMQRNKVAAIRNARTSITSAQNAGCQNTYDRAVEMGIKLQKQWMSTKDDRTRDTHILANGQHVDVDKVFHVGGSELKYPGDTAGAPAEVYNCRCTMVTLDPAVLAMNGDPYDVKGFEEWVKGKRQELLDEHNAYNEKTHHIIDNNTKSIKSTKEETRKNNDSLHRGFFANNVVTNGTNEEIANNVKSLLGINIPDYEKIDNKLLGAISGELARAYDIFGNISDSKYLRSIFIYNSNIDNSVMAYSFEQSAMLLKRNMIGANAISLLEKAGKDNINFWSTSDKEHAIRHEIGHAVRYMFTNDGSNDLILLKRKEISELRLELLDKCNIERWYKNDSEHYEVAGKYLSYYGLADDDEFVAECVAEYMSGHHRETAKRVIEILLR